MEEKKILISASNELCQIPVKGIDTIHMANALKAISDVLNMLPDEEDGEENTDQEG